MKRKLLYIIAVLTFIVSFAFPLAACTDKQYEPSLLKENIVDDNYDNYYEIFVYSFCDSNGDGYGDLNGVTKKLDYIRDLGYTGIWLMPINDSPSYHGYDVRDYYSINSKYGTVADYENLVKKAHEKGIKVIIDLVVNHTSATSPWFMSAVKYKNGKSTDNTYADWYNFFDTKPNGNGYHKNGSVYYEGRFDSSMPDLNLDCEGVRAEIDNIMRFWLEKGTDGFRLDGVKYYYGTSGNSNCVEFCSWIKQTALKYNENAYIIGEMWDSASAIERFYKSGADSFFYFPGYGAQGSFAMSVRSPDGANVYWNALNTMVEIANGYIPAPFLGNHDTARIAGIMSRDAADIKFAYGLLSMCNGNTFTYYGDEIGMLGSYNDPDKRIGMLWDNKKTGMTKPPPETTTREYVFDGVKEQLQDSNSILNYYKICNNARNAFPALMRGDIERISYDDGQVLAFKKTYKGESVTVIINFALSEKSVSGIAGKLAQGICVGGSIQQIGSTFKMPSKSIAILN